MTYQERLAMREPLLWVKLTADEEFTFLAEWRAEKAEMERISSDKAELRSRYGLEAKMRRRMRIQNPIKAIERLDARIDYLARYWNARGSNYLSDLITHLNGLKESLTKYRLDQEELAREAFKPSRVEYSLSCQ